MNERKNNYSGSDSFISGFLTIVTLMLAGNFEYMVNLVMAVQKNFFSITNRDAIIWSTANEMYCLKEKLARFTCWEHDNDPVGNFGAQPALTPGGVPHPL